MSVEDRSASEIITPDAVIVPRAGDQPATTFQLSDVTTAAVTPVVADISDTVADRLTPQAAPASYRGRGWRRRRRRR